MNLPVIKYGYRADDKLALLTQYLNRAGHPTTFRPHFEWHYYTRVLQFQVRMAKENADWNVDDVDGIVGPKTWGALIAIAEGNPEPPPEENPTKKPDIDITLNSPNQSDRGATISTIVLHNTAGQFGDSVSWLCNTRARASAHLVIARDGTTAQLVPFEKKAWHAGNGRINANSIGIEIEAYEGARGMTLAQEAVVVDWVLWLMQKYDIGVEDVGIHRWFRNTSCPGLIWPKDEDFLAWRKKMIIPF
jgi:hypothetical protein